MRNWTIAILFLLLVHSTSAQDAETLANEFLSKLDEKQKKAAQYLVDDPERFNWHFVPRSRNGLNFRKMTPEVRKTLQSLLKVSLATQGYDKANKIIENENVLRELEGRASGDTYRDPANYFVTIFGIPSSDKAWFWRLEGHHLALNFSFNKKDIVSATPTFWGSNPGTVPSGPEKGRQILKLETELAFQLVGSLTDEQKKTAVYDSEAPDEIITGNDRKATLLKPGGLPYPSMNEQQKTLFMSLLDVYVKNYEFGFASRLMTKIQQAGIDKLSFSWAGSLTPGAGHYYRIQGPMLLIEYDNTQNRANHIHSVVRDLTNDFAEDILREHYQQEH